MSYWMPVEEAFITCIYLLMLIIKLISNGSSSSALYYRIQGHTIVLPQNLILLLIRLFASTLTPHNIICIAWASKHPHILSNICFFTCV